jgi:uncharacterized protein YxjI
MDIQGNFLDHEYKIEAGREKVAKVSKKWPINVSVGFMRIATTTTIKSSTMTGVTTPSIRPFPRVLLEGNTQRI